MDATADSSTLFRTARESSGLGRRARVSDVARRPKGWMARTGGPLTLASLLWGPAALAAQAQSGSAPLSDPDLARCPMEVPRPLAPTSGGDGPPPPAWDLRCIELIPAAAGGDARGVVTLTRPPSPFGVTVTAEGRHVHRLEVRLEGLPDPAFLGPYTTFVAWVTPLSLDPVVRLGEVRSGRTDLGAVTFGQFLVMISAEASADVSEREGPLVLRGRSPAALMEAHDLMALAPAAEEAPADGVEQGHEHGAVGAGAWAPPPMYPGVPMLPGMMALEPGVSPLRVASGGEPPPRVRPGQVVRLPDGGTLDLVAGFVRKQVGGRDVQMLAFNGQHPTA